MGTRVPEQHRVRHGRPGPHQPSMPLASCTPLDQSFVLPGLLLPVRLQAGVNQRSLGCFQLHSQEKLYEERLSGQRPLRKQDPALPPALCTHVDRGPRAGHQAAINSPAVAPLQPCAHVSVGSLPHFSPLYLPRGAFPDSTVPPLPSPCSFPSKPLSSSDRMRCQPGIFM